MTDVNSDRLWKMRNLFDILNEKYSQYYSPSEHLAVDEVIVKFKGHVIFRQYTPKKHKRFGIKIYKLCDETGYTYDMTDALKYFCSSYSLLGGLRKYHVETLDCSS